MLQPLEVRMEYGNCFSKTKNGSRLMGRSPRQTSHVLSVLTPSVKGEEMHVLLSWLYALY